MPQIPLPVRLATFMSKDSKCNYKPNNTPQWKANLEGSGEALAANLGKKPKATSASQLSKNNWPSQAHHLIPHKQLKGHQVAKWLKGKSKLYADTYYDVDHENNGKWMPYASGLKEWIVGASTPAQKKKNRDLMFKVMKLANIQLHQGRHSKSNKYGIGLTPYKARVDEYLCKINNHSKSHYAGPNKCSTCSGKKQSGKYPPRENTVRYVDRASRYISMDIKKCRIFVSKIASEFEQTIGFK
jgi:hypothetical protein